MNALSVAVVVCAAMILTTPALAQESDTAKPERRTPQEAQTQNAPATSLGRQYGEPAGNVLVTPANPAAAARRDDHSGDPGITAHPNAFGTQPGGVAEGRPPAGTSDGTGSGTAK